ncbi:hypothetical protein POTOM_013410 [Populus tomentosa]|uniref:GOST seven transmembrane domain-containing protein n=1 Tax=Populus tomentosa TaxID=118781 RepID=A0A8X8A0P0_POPTO|nr:hypothetical protein POTOM_013410 [Populus tomentosa]
MVVKELPVCCTADLAKLGVCSEGEIIHRPSTKNPGRPQNARFWKEVFPLQNCITLVITPGMFEMAFWYFDHAEFNGAGIRPTGIFVELVENVGAVSDLSGNAKLFLVLPVAFLHAFIIIWMFKSLSAIKMFLCVYLTMCEAISERILCGFLSCVESGTALVSSRGESNLND